MRVALVQFDIVWQDSAANLTALDGLLPAGCDLIVLPEMFHCGFSMNVDEVAQHEGGEVLTWMKQSAARLNCCLAGSVAVRGTGGQVLNRLYFVYPNQEVLFYDKRHLFRMAGEHQVYTPGNQRVVVPVGDWRILLQVCYDLRFPVWSRNRNDYDAVVYVANWPVPRRNAWCTLLQARAIENQCYVLGVNRVGEAEGMAFHGDTMVVDPKGLIVAETHPNEQQVLIVDLDLDSLNRFREKFPVWLDADPFEIL
ncbi:MAG: amidohydrolase [Breznakibacter sp.]